MKTIGFIGCGNMGKAFVSGILKAKIIDKDHLYISNAHPEKLASFAAQHQLKISNNQQVAQNSDILFLAIKPNKYATIIDEIKKDVNDETILVSIAAGISIADIITMFQQEKKVAKVMPNTPASVQCAMSAVTFNEQMIETDQAQIITLLNSIGKCEIVEEQMMDAVTAVSGSAPAYMFMMLEAMGDGAVNAGMPRDQAYIFAAQTMLGSAQMYLQSKTHPASLKDMVCSPNGTTIEALTALEANGFRNAVLSAMSACIKKSRAMNAHKKTNLKE